MLLPTIYYIMNYWKYLLSSYAAGNNNFLKGCEQDSVVKKGHYRLYFHNWSSVFIRKILFHFYKIFIILVYKLEMNSISQKYDMQLVYELWDCYDIKSLMHYYLDTCHIVGSGCWMSLDSSLLLGPTLALVLT